MKTPRHKKRNVMKTVEVLQRRPSRPSHGDALGYVVADDVIGTRDPEYDEDNIAMETAELYANVGGRDTREIVVRTFANESALPRVRASRSVIQKALDRLR
jgi:hypothetical protein